MLGLSRTSHWKDMDPGYKYSKWFAQRTTQLGPIGISLRVCWAQNSLISDKKLTSKSLRIQDPKNSAEDGTLKGRIVEINTKIVMYQRSESNDAKIVVQLLKSLMIEIVTF